MKIDELITKLQEIQKEYGNLYVCRENPHPLFYYDTELDLIDIKVVNDTGMFQDFKYVYLEFERDKINGNWKENEDNSITLTIEYNRKLNKKNLILKFRDFIDDLNKEKL